MYDTGMSFARIHTAQVDVISGTIVSVEVDISRGLNAFTIVGLGDRAVDEARDRVSSALKNAGFESPKSKNQKTVISLSPADLKKEGSQFDLAIAVGFLSAEGVAMRSLERAVLVGELGLDGSVRSIRGVLPIVLAAQAAGFTEIYIPDANKDEAALVPGIAVYPVTSLVALLAHLSLAIQTENHSEKILPYTRTIRETVLHQSDVDFSDIAGHESIKRGLSIAATGGHNILLYGPPGTGKTMLARALAGILPPLSLKESIEVAAIHSASGTLRAATDTPPFRAPHHSASTSAVIGGGATLRPGEITLAHKGVLFLDEFPEFDRRVMESLRQPLEEHVVTISRTKGTVVFPAQFIFIAAMNPCPCGYAGSKIKSCTCTSADLARYSRKLSGPLIDRIDITLYVGDIPHTRLSDTTAPSSESIRNEVTAARLRAYTRCARYGTPETTNSTVKAADTHTTLEIHPDALETLNESAARLCLSTRAYHRCIRVARTIADLAASEYILPLHILEALRYRAPHG